MIRHLRREFPPRLPIHQAGLFLLWINWYQSFFSSSVKRERADLASSTHLTFPPYAYVVLAPRPWIVKRIAGDFLTRFSRFVCQGILFEIEFKGRFDAQQLYQGVITSYSCMDFRRIGTSFLSTWDQLKRNSRDCRGKHQRKENQESA